MLSLIGTWESKADVAHTPQTTTHIFLSHVIALTDPDFSLSLALSSLFLVAFFHWMN